MFNKKAEIGYREIFAIIFVLVFAVLWITFQNTKFKPAQEQFFDSEACRLSVLKASLPNQGVNSLQELRGCKTISKEFDETDSETVNELLANNLDFCWYAFGKGKVDFLKWGGTKEVCFICSKFTFLEKVDEVDKNSFEKYLQDSERYKDIKPLILFDKINENSQIYTIFVASRELGDKEWYEWFKIEKVLFEYFVYAPNFGARLVMASREQVNEACESL